MKKIISLLLAVCVIAVAFVGCGKQAKITVKVEQNGDITLEQQYNADVETLEDLLVKHAKELGATLTDSEFGKFVAGMNGYIADSEKKEFFEVFVDDVSSQVGISQIKLEDGKVYKFKLSTY